MYKYYQKNGYNVMYYEFYSFIEFIEYINNSQIKTDIFKSQQSTSNDYDFCQTKTYEEAIELLKYGYHEEFDKLVGLKLKLEKYIKISMKKTKQYNYYVGYAPDVKAYLEGSPLSMLNKTNKNINQIDIYMNTGYSWQTPKEAIYNRGVIVLTLIDFLEKLGYRVNFHLFAMAIEDNQIHYSNFIIKTSSERLNLQKLYFPLCHPSWIRRLIFRLIEVTPDITSPWNNSYGYSCELETINKIIDLKRNDIIIPTVQELNIKGDDIIEDTISVLKQIKTNFKQNNSEVDEDFKISNVLDISKIEVDKKVKKIAL